MDWSIRKKTGKLTFVHGRGNSLTKGEVSSTSPQQLAARSCGWDVELTRMHSAFEGGEVG